MTHANDDLPRLLDLLARAARGDLAAYGDFIDLSLPAAFRLALALTGDVTAAETVVRRCYVDAWRHLPDFAASGRSPLAWLLARLQLGSSHSLAQAATPRTPR